jgi:hypothetical protein
MIFNIDIVLRLFLRAVENLRLGVTDQITWRLSMGFLCDSDKPLVLSSSTIGNISKCGCCNFYHLCIGNITLRLEHKYMLTLTQMIIEALEVNSAAEKGFGGQLRNQA